MPTYILRNTETDEQFEEFCTWDELDKFLNENPKFQQVPSAPHIVGDHIMGAGPKNEMGGKKIWLKLLKDILLLLLQIDMVQRVLKTLRLKASCVSMV